MITLVQCDTSYRSLFGGLRVELPQWQQRTIVLVQVTSVLPVLEVIHNVKAIILVYHSLHDFKYTTQWLTLHDHGGVILWHGLGQLGSTQCVVIVICVLHGIGKIVVVIINRCSIITSISIYCVTSVTCIGTAVCVVRWLGKHTWVNATGSICHVWFFTCSPFTLQSIGHVGIINTSRCGHPTKAYWRGWVGEDVFLLDGIIHRLTASSAVVKLIFQYLGRHTFLYQVWVKLCFGS